MNLLYQEYDDLKMCHKETKGPAGMQDGGIASIEEVLEYDNV